MAGSRLEKIGTIYTRTTGLIQSKALNWEDRPLWYDIYEAFPPKDEPRFDRPAPKIPMKQIFYEEDKIRAIFHRNNKQIGTVNMLNNSKTMTQKFIENYLKLQQVHGEGSTEEQLYLETIDMMKRDTDVKIRATEEDSISLSTAFKEAQNKMQEKPKIDITNIFKN